MSEDILTEARRRLEEEAREQAIQDAMMTIRLEDSGYIIAEARRRLEEEIRESAIKSAMNQIRENERLAAKVRYAADAEKIRLIAMAELEVHNAENRNRRGGPPSRRMPPPVNSKTDSSAEGDRLLAEKLTP